MPSLSTNQRSVILPFIDNEKNRCRRASKSLLSQRKHEIFTPGNRADMSHLKVLCSTNMSFIDDADLAEDQQLIQKSRSAEINNRESWPCPLSCIRKITCERREHYREKCSERKRVLFANGTSPNVFSLSQRKRIRLFCSQKERNRFWKRPRATPEIRSKSETWTS